MFARINKLPLGPFVCLHLAVMAVGGCWLAAATLLAFAISGADVLPPEAAAVVMLLALLSPLPVVWWFTRRLLRRPPRLWLGTTLGFAASPVVGAIVGIVTLEGLLRRYEIDGPASPRGLRTVVVVRDEPLMFRSMFYSDVRVLDPNGGVVAQWRDRTWAEHRGAARALRDSMRWSTPTTLTFVDGDETVQLDAQ